LEKAGAGEAQEMNSSGAATTRRLEPPVFPVAMLVLVLLPLLLLPSFLGGGTVLAGRMREGKACFGSVPIPVPAEVPHEEGSSVELLVRPEQVKPSLEEPEADGPVLGKGTIAEQTFSGSLRRLRLRLPRLSGTRQVAPAVPFGEDSLIVETTLPASASLNAQELWVSLSSWTILEQAAPRLLVVDTGSGPLTPFGVARVISASMGASVTALGFVPGNSSEDSLETVARRAQEAALADFELSTGSGNLAQQIAAQCANALFELVILPANLEGSRPGLDQNVISFLEGADIPVIVAPAEAKVQFSRILICTRAGEPGKSDIRIGGRLARHLGARATLLHVIRPGEADNPRVRRHLHQASCTLTALEVANEVLCRTNENPAEGILEEGASHDLIVIGGHGPQARSVWGRDDITLQILAHAKSPVLIVPAED
jgi:nucleotide-binding universal stress UspA family protein